MFEFVQSIPKAEVHVHIENTLDIPLVTEFASRNHKTLDFTQEQLFQKRKEFSCLDDLLGMSEVVQSVLLTQQDYSELSYSYLASLARFNVTYCEPCFFPGNAFWGLVPFDSIIKGLLEGSSRAETEFGIQTGWILQLLRTQDSSTNKWILEQASFYKEHIAGVGLAGNELCAPSKDLESTFELARNLGLCGSGEKVTVHTGEEASPSSIIETLAFLRPGRLDHAVRSLEDPYLVKFLSESQTPITLCPVSNRKLKVLDRFFKGSYIYHEFIKQNCLVCLNSDDPSMYGAYLPEVYKEFIEQTPWFGPRDLAELAKNSFKCSFLPKKEVNNQVSKIEQLTSKLEEA